MKKLFLQSKNVFLKLLLTILGFTLAASECLAQYMAIRPRATVYGKLIGITDTISRFRVVINNTDTLFTTWANKYTFKYSKELRIETDTIEVSENTEKGKQKYTSVTEIVAIKPDDDNDWRKEVTISLKKKD